MGVNNLNILRSILLVCLIISLDPRTAHSRWVQTNGPYGGSAFCFAVSGKNLFTGTDRGVFLCTNNGTSWTAAGLTYTPVHSLSVSDTTLFAGTLSRGVWRRPLSEMITSVRESPSELPATFTLEQNYPNPFNPTTTIRFVLPRAGFTELMIFNLLGEQVSTVVSERLNAGSYTVSWGAPHLASGVYIYRLQAGDYVETKKLLLIR